jgi:hypothetical protein
MAIIRIKFNQLPKPQTRKKRKIIMARENSKLFKELAKITARVKKSARKRFKKNVK